MQIFVEGGQGTRVVAVEGADGVEELKEKISSSFGVPTEHQLLRVGGRTLKDEQKLEDCGVVAGSTVKLGLRLLGGRGGILQPMDDAYLDGLDLGDREMSDLFGVSTLATVESMGCAPAAGADEMVDSMGFLQGAEDTADEMGDMFGFSSSDIGLGAASSPSHSSSTVAAVTAVRSPHATEGAESQASTAVASPAEPETPEELTGVSEGANDLEMTQPAPATATSRTKATKFELAKAAEPKEYKGQKGVAYDLNAVDDKLKKRLIKNRLSAERSRQKKNARLTELEEQVTETVRELNLHKNENDKLTADNAALKEENEKLRERLKRLSFDGVLDV